MLDVWPLGRVLGLRRALLEKLPFFALAAAAAVVAFLAQASVGAMTAATHLTAAQRVMHAFYGLAFYVWKSLLPIGLAPVYLLDVRGDPAAPRYLLAAAAVVAGTVALVALRRRWPAGLVAFACYAIVVSPVLGLAQSGVQIVADRYAYVSCLPLALLVAPLLARLAVGLAGAVALGALVATLGYLTYAQASVWRDSSTLWSHTLGVDPQNWLAHNMRGLARETQGDLAGALADFDRSIALDPGYSAAYVNRGRARVANGDVRGAVDDWDRALELNPAATEARLNRGGARLMLGDATGAVEDLERAVEGNPESASAWYNLATAHLAAGHRDLAIRDCRRALELAPPGDLRARTERKLAALLAP
jgi:tetratricopeptide (TPR) repeat protein